MCLYPIKIPNKRKQSILAQLNEFGLEIPTSVLELPDTMEVSCGKCFECQRDNSLDWSYRCAIESLNYSENCFVTLTYSNKLDPNGYIDGELHKEHLVKFWKDLRNRGIKFRYFGCGEYGKKRLRPHYHICIFGWCPHDLVFFKKDKSGIDLYLSSYLEEIWGRGFVTVTKGFDTRSAIYSSLYLQKAAPDYIVKWKKVMPFRVFSRRPGIGGNSLQFCDFTTDKIYFNGKYRRIPRYLLDRWFKLTESNFYFYLKERRKVKADIISRCSSPATLKCRRENAKNFFEKFLKKF